MLERDGSGLLAICRVKAGLRRPVSAAAARGAARRERDIVAADSGRERETAAAASPLHPHRHAGQALSRLLTAGHGPRLIQLPIDLPPSQPAPRSLP